MPRGETTVWSMNEVRLRCEEDGGCLIWKEAVNSAGYPSASVNGKATMIRPFVYFELMGRRRVEGLRVATKCGNKRCVSEFCLIGRTHSDVLKRSFAERMDRDPLYLRRYQLIPGAVGHGRLGIEKAQEIRASARPVRELAKEYGVSTECIQAIRSGRTWKALQLPPTSVFNFGG